MEAVKAVRELGYDTALSIVKAKQRPFWAFEKQTGPPVRYTPFIRLPKDSPYARENPPDLYYPTGGVYAFRIKFFETTGCIYGGLMHGVVVSPLEAVDVDDEFDLGYAKYALTVLKNSVAEGFY
jgi:CMP-N-acetylneuraminic acid synthetase